jgi:hypothetical protein
MAGSGPWCGWEDFQVKIDSMLLVAGLVLLALGLLCGALLLLIPLGLIGGTAGIALWILFPVLAVGGYLLAASAAGDRNAAALTRGSGAVLIVLALAAAVALVLQAASIFEPAGSTLSLWYVLVLGLTLGATGLASRKTAT